MSQPVVNFTEFWRVAEQLGYPRDRPAVEKQIGPLGYDPNEAMVRLAAHAQRTLRQRNLAS